MITSPKTMMAGERNGANWFLPFFFCWNGGIRGIRAGGIRFGRMPVANSTSARITMIIGFGTFEFYNAPVEDLKHIFNLIRKG